MLKLSIRISDPLPFPPHKTTRESQLVPTSVEAGTAGRRVEKENS